MVLLINLLVLPPYIKITSDCGITVFSDAETGTNVSGLIHIVLPEKKLLHTQVLVFADLPTLSPMSIIESCLKLAY